MMHFLLTTFLLRPLLPSILSVDDFLQGETSFSQVVSFIPPNIIRLQKNGVVRSSNPVWNVCISGQPIRKGLIMKNTDVFEYRRGHLHMHIPFTCRDYHRGDLKVWKHPDFPNVELLLDGKGRLIGGVPFSFIAVRD